MRHFPLTGYALVRSTSDRPAEESHSLIFTCARHSDVHKHEDDNSFEWQLGGRMIVADTGKYGYRDDAVRRYAVSRPAHSTVSFADDPATLGEYGACSTEPHDHADGRIVLGGAVPFVDGRAHHRSLIYDPGRSLEIDDEVVGIHPGFTQWLHFGRRVEMTPVSDHVFALSTEDGGAEMRVETDPRCQARLHRGQTRPRQGWISVGYLEMEPRWTLGVECGSEVNKAALRIRRMPI